MRYLTKDRICVKRAPELTTFATILLKIIFFAEIHKFLHLKNYALIVLLRSSLNGFQFLEFSADKEPVSMTSFAKILKLNHVNAKMYSVQAKLLSFSKRTYIGSPFRNIMRQSFNLVE